MGMLGIMELTNLIILTFLHSIRGYICCEGNKGHVSAGNHGSKFPSHRLWINGRLTKVIEQGESVNLWKEGKPDTLLVP